jgi:hypothetical protein
VSAERIGRTISRFKMGLVTTTNEMMDGLLMQRFADSTVRLGAIVDIQHIYNEWVGNHSDPWSPYDDAILLPPYDEAVFCYVDSLDQVVMVGCSVYEKGAPPSKASLTREPTGFNEFKWEHSTSDIDYDPNRPPIDWDACRWIMATSLWADKPGRGKVLGPLMSWRFAIRDDGSLEDIRWMNPHDDLYEQSAWDNAIVAFQKAVTWLACRNVELVTPHRSRAEQRRVARTGIDVKEIHVRPIGKTYQYHRGKAVGDGVPLSRVRGHIAKYGVEGRGKLFGKLTGTFWIPAHVRGVAELGEHDPMVVLEPK